MFRDEIIAHVEKEYGIIPDHPWKRDSDSTVFRHEDSRKWFGLILDVNRKNMGLPGNERVDILNVKCDPVLAGSLYNEGIRPAYHMNHTKWISILLDGSVPKDQILGLLDLSYELTNSKRKKE